MADDKPDPKKEAQQEELIKAAQKALIPSVSKDIAAAIGLGLANPVLGAAQLKELPIAKKEAEIANKGLEAILGKIKWSVVDPDIFKPGAVPKVPMPPNKDQGID